jgi:proline iminopeptidase
MYPDIKPYIREHIEVEGGQRLYIEQCGNSSGLPVVFLHGGPGAGCEPFHRRFFDPGKYRIVLFDQRGAGRSTPHATLENNTMADLVTDIEVIRRHLSVDRWVVFGGSWGSTLGLAYAEAYPERVLGMILRGIFLCRDEDIHWIYQQGASRLFPDYWQDFIAQIPEDEHEDFVSAYYRRLAGDDEVMRMRAAEAWSKWEGRCATLLPSPELMAHFTQPFLALSLARIECHYFMNQSFMRPNQLLDEATVLRDIPGVIVHGRYDGICPVDQAWALHRAWPRSELNIIPDAGHAASEPGITQALLESTNSMAERFSG